MTKTPISPQDIRKGDLIRCESILRERYDFTAMEYKADYDKHELPARYGALRYYLLERPEPPFEPKDGARIVKPGSDNYYTAVRIAGEWMGKDDKSTGHWHGVDDWAKKKLAEGWIEIKESKND